MSPLPENPVQQLHTTLASILSQTVILDPETPQRQQVISFKVSHTEKQLLERRCEGITISEYIRGKLFDTPVPRQKPRMSQVNRETLCWLKKMGANLQQHFQVIEHKIEQGQVPLEQEMKGYLGQLEKVQETIHQLRLEMVKAYHQNLSPKDDD